MRVTLGVALAVAVAAGATHAANYGMAGCGLGAVVMGKDGNQILAATTNGLLGSQTFGITTGTLNCTRDGALVKNHEAEAFAEANYATLMRQVATGQGEHLAGFASLVGCQADSAVFTRAQSASGMIFVNERTSAAEVVANFRSVMAADAATASLCRG